MIFTAEQIIQKLEYAFSELRGIKASDLYIGITKNIDDRLFKEHNVTKGQPGYVYYHAIDEDNARLAESYFLNKYKGMKGGEGGGTGDGSAVFVYCYVITPYTRQ